MEAKARKSGNLKGEAGNAAGALSRARGALYSAIEAAMNFDFDGIDSLFRQAGRYIAQAGRIIQANGMIRQIRAQIAKVNPAEAKYTAHLTGEAGNATVAFAKARGALYRAIGQAKAFHFGAVKGLMNFAGRQVKLAINIIQANGIIAGLRMQQATLAPLKISVGQMPLGAARAQAMEKQILS